MTKTDYCQAEIVNALERVGIERGDSIFIHSNLGFFGRLENAEAKEDYVESFRSAIREVIGESGTLVVPTFTYSFTSGEQYDPAETSSNMGMFPEYIRQCPKALRSVDPNFSIAAIGPKAESFTEDPPSNSFGFDSFWERFFGAGGKFCNFNMDAGSTSIHYIERCLDVPYRWDKPFSGTLVQDGEKERRVFYHYVRDLNNPDHEPDFAAFDERARREGVVERADLGKGQIVCISAQNTYDVIEQAYLEDPAFLVKGDEIDT